MGAARPGLVAGVLAAWTDPRGAMAARLAEGPRDSQLLVWALVAAVVGWIAGLPEAMEQARTLEDPEAATGVVLTRLFAAVFVTPLFLLLLGGLSHMLARPFGGQGSYWAGRVALVWAVLVALPLVILNGVASAFLPAAAVSVVSILTLAGFLWFWSACLAEAERFESNLKVFVAICAPFAALAAFLTLSGG